MLYRQIQRKFIFFSQLLARVQFRDEANTTPLPFHQFSKISKETQLTTTEFIF